MNDYENMVVAVFLDRAQYRFNRVPSYMYSLVEDPCIFLDGLCQAGLIGKTDEEGLFELKAPGMAFLRKHKDLVEFYHDSHKDFSLEEYITAKQGLPFDGNYGDVVWSIYGKRELEYRARKDADRLTANYLSMFIVLKREGRYRQAYQMLLKSIYCSLSSLDVINATRAVPLEDPAWIAPASGIFLHDYREYFDESMIDDCLSIPLMAPPSVNRFMSLIGIFINT